MLGYTSLRLNDTSMGLNDSSMGPKTPQWGTKKHTNGHKLLKSVVAQVHCDVASRKVKKSFGAFGGNEKLITFLKKPVSLARAMLGHTGLGLDDTGGGGQWHGGGRDLGLGG